MQFEFPCKLMDEEAFLNALEKRHLIINSSGKIFNHTINGKNIFSDAYIGITQILYFEMVTNGTKLDVYYQSSKLNTAPASLEVIVTFSGNIQFDFTPVSKKLKPFSKSDTCFKQIVALHKEYFQECIKNYLSTHQALLAYCGWFIDEQQQKLFKSVTRPDSEVTETVHSKTEPLILNGGILTNLISKTTLAEYCKQRNNLSDFFTLLANPNALLLFTYTIHALLLDYGHKYLLEDENIPNTNTAIFSLCIYGEDIKRVNTFANLLLNVFDIHRNKWSVISKKIHVSASSISDTKFWKLKLYRDVPIIVTTRNNRFSKSSGFMKRIHMQREKGNFHFFPVYISNVPVNADEIINCCVDDITLDLQNIELLYKLHFDFCALLYHFISFLSEVSGHYPDFDKWPNPIDDNRYITGHIYTLLDEWFKHTPEPDFSFLVDTKLPEFLLLASLECFCRFLNQTPLKAYSEKLKELLKLHLFTEHPTMTTPKGKPDYILHLSDFLQENLQKESSRNWLFDGTEKRGNKEECYYLTTSDGYENFLIYLKKKHISPIAKQAFIKQLETHGLLKLLSSSTAKSNKRQNKYVYIIKKDALNKAIADNINL